MIERGRIRTPRSMEPERVSGLMPLGAVVMARTSRKIQGVRYRFEMFHQAATPQSPPSVMTLRTGRGTLAVSIRRSGRHLPSQSRVWNPCLPRNGRFRRTEP